MALGVSNTGQVSPGGRGFNDGTQSLEEKRECTGGLGALRCRAQAEPRWEATQTHLQGRRSLEASMFLFFSLPTGEALGTDTAEGLPFYETKPAAAAAAAKQQRYLNKSHIYR